MARKKVETVDEVQEVIQDVTETEVQETAPKKRTRKAAVDADVTGALAVSAVAENVEEISDVAGTETVDAPAEQLISESTTDDSSEKKSERPAKTRAKRVAKTEYAVGDVVKTDLARVFPNSVSSTALKPVSGEFVICVDGIHDGRVAIAENDIQIGWISVDELKK